MTVNQEVYRDVLQAGYALHWYEVKSVLGRGAFGVTYLALDRNLDQLVAIKEYFPHDFSSRDSGFTVHPSTGESRELYKWGLDRFIREAQTLAKFKHHNIVRVMSVFELNNTAYMVMEYEQGEELSRLYKKKKNLSEQELLDIFLPMLDGLKLVHHAGFIHRDIKPANIYIRKDGSPVLIDFGAARKTIGTPTRAITSLVTHGYAPFEQYNESEEKQGAWTDIYALGACLYFAVNGKLPLDALARGSSLLSGSGDPYEPVSVVNQGRYSAGFLLAIDHALMFHAQQRPQDVLLWSDMLSDKIEVPPLPEGLYKRPSHENDEDATIILTTPPSVPPLSSSSSSDASLSSASLSGGSPVSGVFTRGEGQVTIKWSGLISLLNSLKELPRTVKMTVLVFLVISVLGVLIAFFLGGEGTIDGPSGKVEKPVVQEKTQLVAVLKNADRARRAGKLLEKDSGAIFLYQQALRIDPANSEAISRIRDIIELSTDGIRSDLAEGFHEKAEKNSQLLLAAAADSPAVIKLLEEVRTAKTNQQQISQLLQQAEADLKANRLISPQNENALFKYRRILAIAPENQDAKKGIETILAFYVSLAKKNLVKGNIDEVERNISDILIIDTDSLEVNKLRNEIKAQQQKVAQEIAEGLAQAQRAFNAGNITSPRNTSALRLYQRVLKIDPDNAKAKQGIQKVEGYLKSQFDKYLAAANMKEAETAVRKIESVMPGTWLARNTRTELERNKSASRPDIEIISELIGKFKKGFESRDVRALRNMSNFQVNRQEFLRQFFNNYTSFKLEISDIKYIGHERKGTANIALTDLINIQGASVEPGRWSLFVIEIRTNTNGQWKVNW